MDHINKRFLCTVIQTLTHVIKEKLIDYVNQKNERSMDRSLSVIRGFIEIILEHVARAAVQVYDRGDQFLEHDSDTEYLFYSHIFY
jgi:hypothetical protein